MPPRDGNSVEVLIDGAEALRLVAEEIEQRTVARAYRGLVLHARRSRSTRNGDPVGASQPARRARGADRRARARLGGAPLPLFRPDAGRRPRDARAPLAGARDRSVRSTARERPLHCHHEKTIVIDDRMAFVGGIDLTSEGGDRFDTPDHPARGKRRLARRRDATRGPGRRGRRRALSACAGTRSTGKRLAAAPTAASRRRRRSSRSSERFPRTDLQGDFRAGTSAILESYVRAIRAAERFIYLENQFLWSPEIVEILAREAAHPPTRRLPASRRCCPAKPNNGADDTRQVARRADRRGRRQRTVPRLHASTPAPARCATRSTCTRSSAIVDDRWLTIGSANLNEHSLFNDTEMNVVIHDPALARETRLRLWSEHLELPIDEISDRVASGDLRPALGAGRRGAARAAPRQGAPHASAGDAAGSVRQAPPDPRSDRGSALRRVGGRGRATDSSACSCGRGLPAAQLRAARRRRRRRGSRSRRRASRAAAPRCRPAGRRSSPKSNSTLSTRPSATVTSTQPATHTEAPNTSQDHAGWCRRGDQRRRAESASIATASPSGQRSHGHVECRGTSSPCRSGDPARRRGTRAARPLPAPTASTKRDRTSARVGRSFSMP